MLMTFSTMPATHIQQALLTGTSEPDAANAKTFKEVPPGEPPSLVNPPEGCRYHPRCPKMIDGECNVEIPPYYNMTDNHDVACWLFKEKVNAA